ncbi:Glycogenin-1 [Bienertia sinuspersici]
MSTRSNLYKNPSFAYRKSYSLSSVLQNLQTYNAITGNTPPTNESPAPAKPRPKRRRVQRPSSIKPQVEVDDGPMSHQDYIHYRRLEASSNGYEELTPDVLGSSTSGVPLVDYGSDSDDSPSMSKELPLEANIGHVGKLMM